MIIICFNIQGYYFHTCTHFVTFCVYEYLCRYVSKPITQIQMESETVPENTEIRHLKFSHVGALSSILDERDDWKKLMSIVRIDCDPNKPLKYTNTQDFYTVEREGKQVNPSKGCTAIFFDEWGTSGRIRPKLGNLLKYLEEAQLEQAAHIVRDEILKIPVSNCDDDIVTINEANRVLPSDESVLNERGQMLSNGESGLNERTRLLPNESQRTYGSTHVFSFKELENITEGFKTKLGSGASGAVFYGKLTNYGTEHCPTDQEIAVKRFENSNNKNDADTDSFTMIDKSFANEIKNLSECKHINLIKLVGVCDDPTKDKCLIYEYMSNGSLNDRLLCLNNTPPLRPSTRYKIALGVAKALKYLHTSLDPAYVHRDVKSANILLNENFVPKLGDFGIVKKFPRNNAATSMYTQTCAGTSAYMPHEQHQGEITPKIDVFSFGIVLLEILTGKCPTASDEHKLNAYDLFYDKNSTELPLLENILDKKVENWGNLKCAHTVYEIATQKCYKPKKEDRGNMKNIENELEQVVENFSPTSLEEHDC